MCTVVQVVIAQGHQHISGGVVHIVNIIICIFIKKNVQQMAVKTLYLNKIRVLHLCQMEVKHFEDCAPFSMYIKISYRLVVALLTTCQGPCSLTLAESSGTYEMGAMSNLQKANESGCSSCESLIWVSNSVISLSSFALSDDISANYGLGI